MARTDDLLDAVGVKEIAARLGVSRPAVEKWQRQGRRGHPFPQPDRLVGGRPAWHWPDIRRWHETTSS